MTDKSPMPTCCPSCQSNLRVKTLACDRCGTTVSGTYGVPVLALLPADDQEFLGKFIQCSGSLKELARGYSISYPTVRNRLDQLIDELKRLESDARGSSDEQ